MHTLGVRCRRLVVAAGVGLCLFAGSPASPAGPQAASPGASQPSFDPRRWAGAIQTFEEWDRKNSPPRDALLFVGSSSIVGWSTATAFSDWPVINRGFGGAHLADVTHFVDRVVTPYRPRLIVLYAGDNDVASGKTAEQVSSDFAAFVQRVRADLPHTPIVFLSIKPSRARWEHWPAMQSANQQIAALCRAQPYLRYVDIGPALLNAQGQPRDELFQNDRLHLNREGYAAWERVVRPVLAELLR